jgi:hypothetical protein
MPSFFGLTTETNTISNKELTGSVVLQSRRIDGFFDSGAAGIAVPPFSAGLHG